MKAFHCTACESLVYFENVQCLKCGNALAYLPDRFIMAALGQGADGLWRQIGAEDRDPAYKLCANYTNQNVCNWAISEDDPESLCRSCRLTRIIPNLTPSNHASWYRLESAKRRLIYSLLSLRLPVQRKDNVTPEGVAFSFLEDSQQPNGDSRRVLTGHDNGLITINIDEADDLKREQQRLKQNEPYRTILGHFRHEIGHYYWDRLIAGSSEIEAFRDRFGDERDDYNDALVRHYKDGPPANWEAHFVSAYASAHPWEDWAESWAHFMLIVDALETAGSVGVSITPRRAHDPEMTDVAESVQLVVDSFDRMMEQWLPLTYLLNNLSRGLGLADSYPFVLSAPVVEKLRFVHDTVVKGTLPLPQAESVPANEPDENAYRRTA
jgi:hypothetical protein